MRSEVESACPAPRARGRPGVLSVTDRGDLIVRVPSRVLAALRRVAVVAAAVLVAALGLAVVASTLPTVGLLLAATALFVAPVVVPLAVVAAAARRLE